MTAWRRDRAKSKSEGQATVEFALILPFLALLLLTAVQVGLLVRTRVLLTHAAREAAREAAVGADDAEVRTAALASADLSPEHLVVVVSRSDGRVSVELRYVQSTDVPLVGPLIGDATFDAAASMRLE